MPCDPVTFALTSPGHLWFPSSRALAKTLDQSGGSVKTLSTGHLVFYRPDGRRFLATDPAGHPLHECEWESKPGGHAFLTRARFRLDWGGWVGLKPGGLVNETTLNLTAKPGWRRLLPDDLRAMAAQALRVPIEEVRWFFRDDDLSIDAKGTATIRHSKDAFYLLDDGGFDHVRFMACMGAMHWDHIDFLPVVELFASLLPGTGSAAFELIRGLYDDQNGSQVAPRTLRYRGVPTYPSEAAYRLFSRFFTPSAPGGKDPLTLFMNQLHSHEVTWLPADDPPVRYFDVRPGLCLTVQGGLVQKATLAEDSTGLSYVDPHAPRAAPFDRSLLVREQHLVLKDRENETIVPLTPGRVDVSSTVHERAPASPVDWRMVFAQGLPAVRPADAYGAVLLYPDGEDEISELSAQPFVADYLQDVGEHDREIAMMLSRAERVLIDNGDAVISTCIPFDRPRDYWVSSRHAAYAQRQAQQLWLQCAEVQRWEWLQRIHIVPDSAWNTAIASQQPYDLIYQWLPYETFGVAGEMTSSVARLQQALRIQGNAFVVGPAGLRELLTQRGLRVEWEESVETLPTVRIHKTILPKARVKEGLTLFHVRRP